MAVRVRTYTMGTARGDDRRSFRRVGDGAQTLCPSPSRRQHRVVGTPLRRARPFGRRLLRGVHIIYTAPPAKSIASTPFSRTTVARPTTPFAPLFPPPRVPDVRCILSLACKYSRCVCVSYRVLPCSSSFFRPLSISNIFVRPVVGKSAFFSFLNTSVSYGLILA